MTVMTMKYGPLLKDVISSIQLVLVLLYETGATRAPAVPILVVHERLFMWSRRTASFTYRSRPTLSYRIRVKSAHHGREADSRDGDFRIFSIGDRE
jgi:hypothetical protein